MLERAASALRQLRRQAVRVEGGSADAVRPSLMGLEGTAGRLYWSRSEGCCRKDWVSRGVYTAAPRMG